MYHVETIDIKKGMSEFAYLNYACHCANNMYNVANFFIRNLMTGLQKSPKERTPNEEEVIRTVEESIPHINESLLAKHKHKNKQVVPIKRDSGRVSARCSGNRTEAP